MAKPVLDPKYDLDCIDKDLAWWISNETGSRNKKKAAEAIREAYLNKSKELDLRGLDLNILPDCIAKLDLETLDLSNNGFTVLPVSVCYLTGLTSLNLGRFITGSIPNEIALLSNLKELHLENNVRLSRLPMALNLITSLETININGTKLDPAECKAILDMCRARREKNTANMHQLRCKMWKSVNNIDLNLDFSLLNAEQQTKLNQWFDRLERYVQNEDCDLLRHVNSLSLLNEVISKSNLRELFFSKIDYYLNLPEDFILKSIDYLLLIFVCYDNNIFVGREEALDSHVRSFQEVQKNIDWWLFDPSSQGYKRQAFIDFKKVFIRDKTKVQLGNCNLNKIPDCFFNFPDIRSMNLSINYFESFPSGICNLSQLRYLNLSFNKLHSLPVEIGRLVSLETLSVENNQNLSELPLSLGQLPFLYTIERSNTGISKRLRNSILEQCKALRKKQAELALPLRLESWQAIGGTKFNLEGVCELEQKDSINEWLFRLEKTKQYNSKAQAAFAKIICKMLVDVIKDKDFQELFLAQIATNLEACEDRAAMALNEIYTAWMLSKKGSAKEKLEIMIQGAKTIALRQALAVRMEEYRKQTGVDLGESVEVYLYYEVALKQELNLLSVIDTMRYDVIGKKDWIDQDQLIARVNETYLDHLIQFSSFDAILKKDRNYLIARIVIVKEFNAKIEKLYNAMPEGDETSEIYLNWQHELGKLTQERESRMAVLKRNCFEQLFNTTTT
jgi:Leucine-rich repeat (LRR) protein